MIRIGIIGTGGMAHGQADCFRQIKGVKVVSCCDVVKSRAEAFAKKFEVPTWYDNFEEIRKIRKHAPHAREHRILALLCRERRIQRQFCHTDDAVHWGSNFVAHVREEFALGACGFLGAHTGIAHDNVLLLDAIQHVIEIINEQPQFIVGSFLSA